MSGFFNFMRSTPGRVLRVALGLILIWLGLFGPLAGNWAGWVVAIVGLVPIIMGISGPCLMQSVLGSKS